MRPKPGEIDRLMDRASAGHDGAMGLLASAVQDDLFRFALAQGLRAADAAEVVQETLLRAYRGRKRWQEGSRAMPWLMGIEMNVVREWRRKRARQVDGIDWSAVSDPVSGLAEAPHRADADGEAARGRELAAAMEALPPRQREALACRYLRRMSIRDTAAAMGCAEGTVKAAAFAGLANLRQKLGHRGPAE